MNFKKVDIPSIFYDTVEEKPIEKCQLCEAFLLSDHYYFIEKAFRKTEVIYEFALCYHCINKMKKKISKESLKKMENYMKTQEGFLEREKELNSNDYNDQDWLGRCAITQKDKSELEEHVIVGMFEGNQMLASIFPYAISTNALENLQSQLSEKTKEEMGNFKNDLIKPSPELEDIFTKPSPIFV